MWMAACDGSLSSQTNQAYRRPTASNYQLPGDSDFYRTGLTMLG